MKVQKLFCICSLLFFFFCSLSAFGQKDSIVFIGDFNNGIIAKDSKPNTWQKTAPHWPNNINPNSYKWKLDSVIVRQGKYSLRSEVRPGDSCCGFASERAEIVGMNDPSGKYFFINEKSGIQYFAFSIRLDPNWQSPFNKDTESVHSLFLQLHKNLHGTENVLTGPAISFQVFNSFFIRVNSGNIHNSKRTNYKLSNGNLNRGKWIDFIMKIKYTPDTSGEIVIWRRDENESDFSMVLNIKTPTLLYDSSAAGIKVFDHLWHTGYYRAEGASITNYLWLDGFTIAKTAAAAQKNAFNNVVDLPDSVPNAPTVSINDASLKEGNSGTKLMNFTVSLSNASKDTIWVRYKTGDLTAFAPTDYTTADTLLTFKPGQTIKKVSITVNGDTTVESNEKFNIQLYQPVNIALGNSIGFGTIENDDTSFAGSIKIYPNPVTDVLHLDLVYNENIYVISVIDITGHIIKEIKTVPGQKNISINTGNLSSGGYLLKIQSGKENTLIKFIKQ